MRHALVVILSAAAACGGERASPAPAPPVTVEVHGALRELMHGGPTDGRVALADAVTPATIAVGALEGLRGEVTVLDGEVRVTVADGDTLASSVGPGAHRAALLIRADVPAWRAVPIPGPIAADELDARLGELLRAAGAVEPTPLVIEGELTDLAWHVVAGPHVHGEPAGPTRHTPGRAVVVGFYSTRHEGVFTHLGQATHLHALTAEGTGHVERVAIGAGAVLRVPR